MRLRKRAVAGSPRICLSYEAGRDGFWLAHWLQDHGIEAHVMHPISVSGQTGASPGKDGSSGLSAAVAGLFGLAARRGALLPNGRGSH